ncbi:MAG: DUF2330 domain-containing protein [Myxococcales bacterium]|nr:DUF2330 domain-containing protein [Myxococcales bacterium]
MRISTLVSSSLVLAALAISPSEARACGGFFCNGGGAGPTPVVQAAERVIFEERSDGTVRAYVQIQYSQQGGVPIGFSWLIPTMSAPELGVAEAATFDELDGATAPQFRFVNPTFGTSSGGGAGCGGSGGDALAGAPDRASSETIEGVTVWETSRVGDYQTAILSGDTSEAILTWLQAHGYDIPDEAGAAIDFYVYSGHVFSAFRYDPLEPGDGSLPPIVITYAGSKPCVPLRITAIASTPILDVMVLAFGSERAKPVGDWVETVPDYSAIQQDFTAAGQTTYADEVRTAIVDAGGNAFVVEHAGASSALQGLSDPEALAIASRSPYVTRFYTRLPPEEMTVDPEFEFTAGTSDVARLHVIDLSPPSGAFAPFGLLSASLLLGLRRRRRRPR